MSLNSLASSRVAYDVSTSPPKPATGAAPASAAPASAAPASGRIPSASADTLGPKKQDVQNALSALVEYVPAETITLYLATIASLPVLIRTLPSLSALGVYIFFAALTPILFALIYAGKRRAAGEDRWPKIKAWPWWPMIAATIAFLAWGVAVPEGPFFEGDEESGRVLGGLLAIFTSTLLGVAGRVFGPKPV